MYFFCLTLLSFVYARTIEYDKDDCKEILNYIKEKYPDNNCSCTNNSEGKVVELNIENREFTDADIKKILSYNTINKLVYTLVVLPDYELDDNTEIPDRYFSSAIGELTNLEDLTIKYDKFVNEGTHYSNHLGPMADGILKNLKNLKKLTLNYISLSETNFEEIFTLSNLEDLTFERCTGFYKMTSDYKNKLTKLTSLTYYCGLGWFNGPQYLYENNISNFQGITKLYINGAVFKEMNFKEISTLSNLTELTLTWTRIKEIPEDIGAPENLTTLILKENELTKFPSTIQKLTNLEILDLSYNDIEDEIPNYFNSFKNLKEVDFSNNSNVTGVTLNNDSLTECKYDLTNICYKKHVSCLDSKIEACSDSDSNNNNNNNNNNVSTTGQCGKDHGICPTGNCCSRYGYCGATKDHCSAAKGCQSEFGHCDNDITTTSTTAATTTIISTDPNGKCGQDIGRCASGKCCSKYGYCGTTSDYCSAAKGCQSEFGHCDNDINTNTTTTTVTTDISTDPNGKCGQGIGRCAPGKCCSKYGYCGVTSDYCSTAKGCQSEFGECDSETIKDDCKKILNYIQDKYPERSCDCTNNSKGEVVELNIDNHEFTDEDIKKILSYNTINKLIYTLDDNDEKPDRFFSSAIGELINLEDLTLNYDKIVEEGTRFMPYFGPLTNGTLKNLKNLKKLYVL